jgi:hypothetical protein
MPKAARRRRGPGTGIPGISRIDQESTRTHGYFVRVGYRRTTDGWRPRHTAYFGDASYGGKKGAFGASQKWLKAVAKAGGRKVAKPAPKKNARGRKRGR